MIRVGVVTDSEGLETGTDIEEIDLTRVSGSLPRREKTREKHVNVVSIHA